MEKSKFPRALRRPTALLLSFLMVFSTVTFVSPVSAAAAAAEGPTGNVLNREAEPSSMMAYKDLLLGKNDARYAGRVWGDKSVFAYGSANADNEGGGHFLGRNNPHC